MIKDSKPINLVFRLCIFTVFALCTITSSKIILYTLRLAEADKNNDESTMLTNMTKLIECFKRFDWILWLTVICAVLSILTCYRATKISVVFRSVLLIIAAFLLLSFKETNDSFIKIYTIFIDEGAELRNLSDQKAMSILIKAGIDSSEADELIKTVNSENSLVSMVAAYVVTSVTAFLLSLTSLHNLFKKNGSIGETITNAFGMQTDYGQLSDESSSEYNTYYNDDEEDF